MSLASVVGDNENIIEYHIEPYLIQKGLITIKKTGRVCTELGYAYIKGYLQKGENEDESKRSADL
jgi:Holliday junction resolvasome RuvABC ATP-dependent DNA helicase subunit